MAIFIIFVLIMAGIGVGAYFGLKYFLNKTVGGQEDISTEDGITETYQFLPFRNISDSMIDLGDGQYRAIIECNSINYGLRTGEEQEIIEASFQRFLSSVKEPITFFIQTRNIDNTKVIENLRKSMETSLKMFPNLESYANVHLNDMQNLSQIIGNNKSKHKYIIISFNDTTILEGLSESEQYDIVNKELYQKCKIIMDSLSNVGIYGKILTTMDLFELIYYCYHKDGTANVNNLLDGGFLASIISGTDRIQEMSPAGQLDWILHETEMKLKTQLIDNINVNETTKKKAINALSEVEKIRDELAGYYKR